MTKTYSSADRNAAALHLTCAKLAKSYGPNDPRPIMLMSEEMHRSLAKMYISAALQAHARNK